MKKILTILLSVFMVFSSGLMVSADEANTELNVTQNENGDLVFNIQNGIAETYLSAVADGTISILADLIEDGSYVAYGELSNEVEANIVRNGNNLTVSKQTLLDKGLYSGTYEFCFWTKDNKLIVATNVNVDLGKDFSKTSSTIGSFKLVGEIPQPKDGESTTIDTNKLYLVDENGAKVDNEQYELYWEYSSTSGSFYPVDKEWQSTFIGGMTYRLAISYGYIGEYGNISIANDEANFFVPNSWSPLECDKLACNYDKEYNYSDYKGSYLNITRGRQFRSNTTWTAKTALDVEPSASQNSDGDLIISATGSYAKEFIDSLCKEDYKNGDLNVSSYISVYHENGYYGSIGRFNADNKIEKIDGNTAKVSKQNLISGGYVDGKYTVTFNTNEHNDDYSTSKSYNYPKTNITLSLGNTVTPNMSSKINIQVNMSAPVEGQKTEVDLSKIVITDENGNKL